MGLFRVRRWTRMEGTLDPVKKTPAETLLLDIVSFVTMSGSLREPRLNSQARKVVPLWGELTRLWG